MKSSVSCFCHTVCDLSVNYPKLSPPPPKSIYRGKELLLYTIFDDETYILPIGHHPTSQTNLKTLFKITRSLGIMQNVQLSLGWNFRMYIVKTLKYYTNKTTSSGTGRPHPTICLLLCYHGDWWATILFSHVLWIEKQMHMFSYQLNTSFLKGNHLIS